MSLGTGGAVLLPGVWNLRDMGGCAVKGGRVRRGLLFRGGDLADLLPEARDALEAAGIRTIVDFREDAEKRLYPDSGLRTVRNRFSLPVRAGNIVDFSRARSVEDAGKVMIDLYRRLPFAALEQYREFFRIISRAENAPVLFHCSAGKDRTGFAAALILSALGAERGAVVEDYCLSAILLAGKYDETIRENPVAAPYMTVRREYIEAAFDAVEREAGSAENYLENHLMADAEKLRKLYLEDGGT